MVASLVRLNCCGVLGKQKWQAVTVDSKSPEEVHPNGLQKF